jgi:N-acetylglutamate synthase-like GNAT family acetyltransferase
MACKKNSVSIRRAQPSDARRIAELSGQLGYPTTAKQMAKRLEAVLKDRDAACFLAETKEQGVVGWVHLSFTPLVEVQKRAEVNGLVVEEATRSQGAGALLLEAGERWARKQGCKGVSVRSNVIRKRAHAFYLRHGYEHYKTQKAFRKTL